MEVRAMLGILDRLLDDAKIAVLANSAEDGSPSVRWMSPALVRGREGYLYAVTSSKFTKTNQLEKSPKVMWMVQTKALDEIMSIKGNMHVLRNPSLQQEVIEAIGSKLGTFWKLNKDTDDVVVLETVIEELEYFAPAKNEKSSVRIK